MLNREEQQRLVEIERWFSAAEPDLARELSDGPHARRRLVPVLLAVVVGATLVLALLTSL